MSIPDPTPVAKGLAVAAACIAGIPAAYHWVEAHPAMGFVALLVLVRFSASRASLPGETVGERRTRIRDAANRLQS